MKHKDGLDIAALLLLLLVAIANVSVLSWDDIVHACPPIEWGVSPIW